VADPRDPLHAAEITGVTRDSLLEKTFACDELAGS
jgi:hypothetical protein